MPKRLHESDWDYFFGQKPHRRRGPIGLFVTIGLALVFVVLLWLGGIFGVRQYDKVLAAQALTATPLWDEYYQQQTATAQANAVPTTPTPTPLPTAHVAAPGNFRAEPRIANDTVIGQMAAGDVVAIIEQQTIDSAVWLHVRVASSSAGVAPGTEGWISSSLVATP